MTTRRQTKIPRTLAESLPCGSSMASRDHHNSLRPVSEHEINTVSQYRKITLTLHPHPSPPSYSHNLARVKAL